MSTISKANSKLYDVTSLYDQVELNQPSTRVKRKLKILNSTIGPSETTMLLNKPTVSPTKHLPSIAEAQEEKTFGRPTKA